MQHLVVSPVCLTHARRCTDNVKEGSDSGPCLSGKDIIKKSVNSYPEKMYKD